MRLTLEVSGRDLVLLYLATGNEDAGKILKEAAQAEREFTAQMIGPVTRRGSKRESI